MKIKYKFATETIEIDVAEKWGDIVVELNRLEYNTNHAETRRHTSLSSFAYEDRKHFADGTDLLAELIDSEAVSHAMSLLTDRQQYLIRKCFIEGWSYTDLAALEGVDESAIRHAVKRAKERLKKIYRDPVRIPVRRWHIAEGNQKSAFGKETGSA